MMTKSEFVRSRPMEMPVKQVVAEAKEVGLTLNPGNVHQVRSSERKKKKDTKAQRKDRSLPAHLRRRHQPGSTQSRVLEFVRDHLAKHNVGPDRALIAEKLGVTVHQVSSALTHLKSNGSVSYPKEDVTKIQIRKTTNGSNGSSGHAPSYAGLLGPGAPTIPLADLDVPLAALERLLEGLKIKAAAIEQVIAVFRR